jgi:hypothetical protein
MVLDGLPLTADAKIEGIHQASSIRRSALLQGSD